MNLIEKIDNFNKSPKGKIFKSIFTAVLSLIMLVSVSLAYAWFFTNRDIGSNNAVLTTNYKAMETEFTSYYIEDLDSKEIEKGVQYQNAAGQSVLDINMLPYETIFETTNQYAPIVIRVVINDITAAYIPAANQTKYVSLVISRNTSLSPASNNRLDAYFSSVGQIGCYANSTLSLSSTNQTIYNTVLAQYRADQNISKFTTKSDSTYTKVNFLDKSIAYTSADIKTNAQGENCLVLYMCFDYNSILAKDFASQQTGISSNFEQKYDISNDISSINVDFN